MLSRVSKRRDLNAEEEQGAGLVKYKLPKLFEPHLSIAPSLTDSFFRYRGAVVTSGSFASRNQ